MLYRDRTGPELPINSNSTGNRYTAGRSVVVTGNSEIQNFHAKCAKFSCEFTSCFCPSAQSSRDTKKASQEIHQQALRCFCTQPQLCDEILDNGCVAPCLCLYQYLRVIDTVLQPHTACGVCVCVCVYVCVLQTCACVCVRACSISPQRNSLT